MVERQRAEVADLAMRMHLAVRAGWLLMRGMSHIAPVRQAAHHLPGPESEAKKQGDE